MQLILPFPCSESSIEDLAAGAHERCAWCKMPFVFTEGKLQRYRALDGKYYCDETHASAPYIMGVANDPLRTLLAQARLNVHKT